MVRLGAGPGNHWTTPVMLVSGTSVGDSSPADAEGEFGQEATSPIGSGCDGGHVPGGLREVNPSRCPYGLANTQTGATSGSSGVSPASASLGRMTSSKKGFISASDRHTLNS